MMINIISTLFCYYPAYRLNPSQNPGNWTTNKQVILFLALELPTVLPAVIQSNGVIEQ